MMEASEGVPPSSSEIMSTTGSPPPEATPVPKSSSFRTSPEPQRVPSQHHLLHTSHTGAVDGCPDGTVHRVLPFLYLGSKEAALDSDFLKRANVKLILNLSNEGYWVQDPTISVVRLDVLDRSDADILPIIKKALRPLTKAKDHWAASYEALLNLRPSSSLPRRNVKGPAPRQQMGEPTATTASVGSLSGTAAALVVGAAGTPPADEDQAEEEGGRQKRSTEEEEEVSSLRPEGAAGGVATACSSSAASEAADVEYPRPSLGTVAGTGAPPITGRVSSPAPPPTGESAAAIIASTSMELPPAVLVHCQKGISRSVSVVAAYLMQHNGWSADEAIAFVRQKRPQAQPNMGFYASLQQWEVALASKYDRAALVQERMLLLRDVAETVTDAHLVDTVAIYGDVVRVERRNQLVGLQFSMRNGKRWVERAMAESRALRAELSQSEETPARRVAL